MKVIYPIFLCLLCCALIGCNSEPFEVISSDLKPEVGNALVSVSIPPFSRGLIQRVRLQITSAGLDRIRSIEREMNFPIPGGNLASGQVTDIPAGKRRFTVRVFDTLGEIRFRGNADSTITSGETQLVQIELGRIGGQIDFKTVINFSAIDTTSLDRTRLMSLPSTSVLDVLELVSNPSHNRLTILPLLSVGLGGRFTVESNGSLSRIIRVSQVPTGRRRFVAHLRDLSSNGTLALADTIVTLVDTLHITEAVFNLKQVRSSSALLDIFSKTALPSDSTVVVVTSVF
ncbi:MAG: hypothetical protein O7G87_08385 [bacterium]|nr:hypothetical protein [bacterium]